MSRDDGRSGHQIRVLSAENGLLNRADGSCRFCTGDTNVLVGIHGPMAARTRQELSNRAFILVQYSPLCAVPGPECSDREEFVRSTLEHIILSAMHPRTCISISSQLCDDDGSSLATTVNAACLACMDAGIDMLAMVAAVTCVLTEEDVVILDPTHEEEMRAKAIFILSFASSGDDIVASWTEGTFSTSSYLEAVRLCKAGSRDILKFMRTTQEAM